MPKQRNRVRVYTSSTLVRLTEEQNEIIKQAASDKGMKLGEYMRHAMIAFSSDDSDKQTL